MFKIYIIQSTQDRYWIYIEFCDDLFNYQSVFQTFLVSGGLLIITVLSTELLEETADLWVYTGELPSPHSDLRGANIDNKFLVTGKRCQIIILLSSKCSLNNDDSY